MALSFENARALILSKVAPLPAVSVPLIDSVGRVAAAEESAFTEELDRQATVAKNATVQTEGGREVSRDRESDYNLLAPSGGAP